ncbi:efflux transporter outer membrane subunit [Chitinolyticbacter meiyuanensis]|uniref:efflux transporter outer membrane subunit n=1 Tax=Chitinolyticbacter meiyuanensis TaxID=682798 RepID=UPI0011E5CC69|nr:efflux transporter outer membrane subunit [Chitinolyticbacter meiyuanensis]
MNYPKHNKILLLLAAAFVLAGCAAIPDDAQTVARRDLAGTELAQGIKLAREGWPEAQWWTAWHDAQLDALMARALKEAPTLASAQARVRQAESSMALTDADGGLNATLDASVDRQYLSATGLFPPPIGGEWYTDTKVGLNASYEFDWWGKHRSQVAASLGEMNARRAEEKQAELTLSVAVAQSYFTLQSDRARLASLKERRALQAKLVAGRARRVAQGLEPMANRAREEGQLAAFDAQIATLEATLGRQHEAIRALVGGGELAELQTVQPPHANPALPASLGNELLARRPDLQAARWRVESTISSEAAQQAAFYPTVSIAGFAGFDTITTEKLFDFASRQINLIPAISLPIFDAGRLQARLGGKRADRDAMIAEYNQAVTNAVRDIAQDGIALQGLAREESAQQRQLAAQRQVLASGEAQFKQGLVDRTAVWSATLPVLAQNDALIQLNQRQLDTELQLIKALGGGYRAGTTQE